MKKVWYNTFSVCDADSLWTPASHCSWKQKGVQSFSESHQPSYEQQHRLDFLALSPPLSNSFPFFFCFAVILLALWSRTGSGPRTSPQRHNYHTWAKCAAHKLQYPSKAFRAYSKPLLLRFSQSVLSPLTVCFIHRLCLFGFLPPSHALLCSLSLVHSIIINETTQWRLCNGCCWWLIVSGGHMLCFQTTHIHNPLPNWMFKQKAALVPTADS